MDRLTSAYIRYELLVNHFLVDDVLTSYDPENWSIDLCYPEDSHQARNEAINACNRIVHNYNIHFYRVGDSLSVKITDIEL